MSLKYVSKIPMPWTNVTRGSFFRVKCPKPGSPLKESDTYIATQCGEWRMMATSINSGEVFGVASNQMVMILSYRHEAY